MRLREALVFATICAASAALAQCSSPSPTAEDEIRLPGRGGGDAGDAEAGPVLPPRTDAAPPPPPPPDCDLGKPFGAPTLLAGFDESTEAFATPRLSQDERTIYFTGRGTLADGGTHSELCRAERPSRSAPFGASSIMAAQSSLANDNDPAVAADHLSLWFHSSRSGNAELYFATRASTAADFGPPGLVPGVNTTAAEAHAYYRAAGSELWFISTRGGGPYDIYVARRLLSDSFDTPMLLSELSSPAQDWQPAPTEDGLKVVFASNRDGGAGGYDLYLATRSSVTENFEPPRALAELNSPSAEFAGWLSPDGCRIYFSSDRETTPPRQRLWYAERPK